MRGTVQADILKEDQAQNTCIFSTEFALRMMGDIQQYFVDNDVDSFYSVSISGYHMAEAGANPITQLAFTLANGFTYIENYLARGMDIDDFAPNLSFFFSNGIDAEYAVIGRVARRIWAKAIKHRYGGNDRSQKLKYHVQTSGRSLHAQEISFNDIRTTLQALYAIYDNTNSLHTNAYDEAITTPTEESVRRAVAIQLIINRELGLTKNENPLQGSFIIEELTDLVEEAVLLEFERLNSRGGVLGAMERQYQRTKIQEESLYYEQQKESGLYPIVGVNTFISKAGSPFVVPEELIRSTTADKDRQITNVRAFQDRNAETGPAALVAVAKGGGHRREHLQPAHGDRQSRLTRPDEPGPLRRRRPIPPQHVGEKSCHQVSKWREPVRSGYEGEAKCLPETGDHHDPVPAFGVRCRLRRRARPRRDGADLRRRRRGERRNDGRRSLGVCRRAPSRRHGHRGQRSKRRAHRHRRAVRRDQGADRWLLDHRGRRSRRRSGLGSQGDRRLSKPGGGPAIPGRSRILR